MTVHTDGRPTIANRTESMRPKMRPAERRALDVWEVATRKGMLFVTDPETGSDALVGYFVPAHEMNEMAKALAEVVRA